MEITQVKETCLYITDIDHSYEFYHSLMGLPVINRVDGRHIFFRAGTSVLLCFIAAATTKNVLQMNDGWTIISADKKPSAHFEHDVAVVNGKPEILSTFKYVEEALAANEGVIA